MKNFLLGLSTGINILLTLALVGALDENNELERENKRIEENTCHTIVKMLNGHSTKTTKNEES